MQIDLSANEMWKIIDSIKAYKSDYAVSGAVEKVLNGIVKKLTDKINQDR